MKRRSFIQSFIFAASGIAYCLKTQKNMRFHVTAAAFVLVCSFFLRLNRFELIALLLTIAMVFICEMFNTALEKAVDVATEEFHPYAKAAKDVAAGAVLVSAINAVAVGCIIFGGKILQLLIHLIKS